MIATVIYRMEESPVITVANGFSDVAQDTWYTDAITWAAQNGIISGYDSGLFGTNDPVSREQIAAILWRYSDSPATDEITSGFADTTEISAYAIDAVSWARLPENLPTASEQVGNIQTGDLMLYGSDCLMLFYKSFSTSYNYTKLGYVEDISGLASALGHGNVVVDFHVE